MSANTAISVYNEYNNIYMKAAWVMSMVSIYHGENNLMY